MELKILEDKDMQIFKRDMQEAFQLGAVEGSYDLDDDEVILPEADIDQSLQAKGSVAYKAVD